MSEVGNELILPKERIKATRKSPRRLIIYSKPKTGKTSAIAGLDKCLLLDFECGSEFVDAMKVKVDSIDELTKVGDEIKKQGKPYKYIAIDTVTRLEDMIMPLACKKYRQTQMGQHYAGDNVLKLPNGSGWLYFREAFSSVINYIDTLADNIILLGHLKDKILEKDGKEVASVEIDLQGKNKSILCANADAIALMYRKDNQNILTFKTSEFIICGARPAHLRNKEVIISEQLENNTVKTFWSNIYID